MNKIKASVAQRQTTLEAIRQNPNVSVLIVGGGINGAGLFRDLALQGIDVLLVDKSDFCAGASAAPSRMIHGGLRYLEFGEFRLVRESVLDRNLLLKNAGHYVKPLPTTIPIFSWFSGAVSSMMRFFHLGAGRPSHRGAAMVKAGLTFYDIFTRKTSVMPRHKFTSRKKSLAQRPLLNPGLINTATYYDAWISYPERLCLELLMDGEQSHGAATALNYVSLQGGAGQAVSLKDELSGEVFEVKPDVLINATGAWIDFANRRLGRETKLIGGTKGAHLILENDALMETLQGDMIYYETDDGRVSVVLPWMGKVLAGSTDIRVDDPETVRCEEDEIDYILESIHQVFPKIKVDRSQIVSHFSGVRPLRYSGESATVQVSRDHLCDVVEPSDEVPFPVYSLVGGKWTTFRAFAEQVTDRLLAHFAGTRRTGTEDLAIGGGKDFPKDPQSKDRWLAALQERTGLSKERLAVLLERYGTRAEQVAAFCVEQSDQPLTHHDGYTNREIEFILRHEGVMHLDDLLLRRTTIALLGELTADLLAELVTVVAPLRQWSEEETRGEVERTLAILEDRHGIKVKNPS
jgi:glycerol-3-phosphate dehydrogenase